MSKRGDLIGVYQALGSLSLILLAEDSCCEDSMVLAGSHT
jgi:hypothetical protein